MNKLLPVLFLLAIISGSCKKERGTGPTPSDGKTYSVKFNVSGFTEEITSGDGKKINSLNIAANAPGLQRLYYRIFKSDGKLYHEFIQDSTASNFGQLEDSLPAGSYDIVIYAGSATLTGNNTTFNNGYLKNPGDVWKDLFFKKISITVTNSEINQDVTLNRVVGKLTLKLLDNLPPDAKKIMITVDKDYDSFFFRTETPGGTPKSRTIITNIPASAIGKPNFSVSTLLLIAATDITVNIRCYDSADKIIGQAQVSNVSVQPNTQTVLSGKLFNADTDFVIGLDQSWDTPIDIQF